VSKTYQSMSYVYAALFLFVVSMWTC